MKTISTVCTFPGKRGDILWSLATAKMLATLDDSKKVDFVVMPQYADMLPLLQAQSYIDNAIALNTWECTGSPHGDQPWLPPKNYGEHYKNVYHLGYRGHPGINADRFPLIDFVAFQQNLALRLPVVPFIDTKYDMAHTQSPEGMRLACNMDDRLSGHIAVAFNEQYAEEKKSFLQAVVASLPNLDFYNVAQMSWQEAAVAIANASAFLGDRSSNWVLACGVGQKRIVTFEPNPARNKWGQFGDVFGCPYVDEKALHYDYRTINVVQQAVAYLNKFVQEREHEIAQSVNR